MKTNLEIRRLKWWYGIQHLILHPYGQVSLYYYPQTKEWWINGLYVDEEHRGEGIAAELLDACDKIAQSEEIHIQVEINHVPKWLVDYYESRGYVLEIDEIE